MLARLLPSPLITSIAPYHKDKVARYKAKKNFRLIYKKNVMTLVSHAIR